MTPHDLIEAPKSGSATTTLDRVVPTEKVKDIQPVWDTAPNGSNYTQHYDAETVKNAHGDEDGRLWGQERAEKVN